MVGSSTVSTVAKEVLCLHVDLWIRLHVQGEVRPYGATLPTGADGDRFLIESIIMVRQDKTITITKDHPGRVSTVTLVIGRQSPLVLEHMGAAVKHVNQVLPYKEVSYV